jgi:GT2 family glycosyltransferase
MSTHARATIGFVPRESFSQTERSLETIYARTEGQFELVCIDGGSPPVVKQYLEHASREKGFALVRTDEFLIPNQARNLVLDHVNTEYVVFVDNDILVAPGWLDALVRCADETGAWAVGPLTLNSNRSARSFTWLATSVASSSSRTAAARSSKSTTMRTLNLRHWNLSWVGEKRN